MSAVKHRMREAGRPRMLVGLFPDREGVELAYRAVCLRGYRRIDVNLLMTDEARGRWFPAEDRSEAAALDRHRGGTSLRISLVVPGLGMVVAGLLTVGRIRAGEGGRAGGLVPLLSFWGLPEDRAMTYEVGLLQGGILMEVNPRDDDDARGLLCDWKAARGEHVYCYGPTPPAPDDPAARPTPDDSHRRGYPVR